MNKSPDRKLTVYKQLTADYHLNFTLKISTITVAYHYKIQSITNNINKAVNVDSQQQK